VSELATPMRRSRRRRPRFLRGVRRIAYVLLAIIAAVALWHGMGEGAGMPRAIGGAVLAAALVGVAYFAILYFTTSASGSVRHFVRDLVKARKKRRLTRLDRAVQLVTWVAAGSAAWLVINFPDYEPDNRELVFALVVSVAFAVGVVQLVGWILKGFVRSE
jgi:hypothetical protein